MLVVGGTRGKNRNTARTNQTRSQVLPRTQNEPTL